MIDAFVDVLDRMKRTEDRGDLGYCRSTASGTELPTSALQRFRPESEGQQTFGERTPRAIRDPMRLGR